MTDLFFTGRAAWFSIPALVGTLVFVLRVGLMLAGGHGPHAGGHSMDHADGHAEHGDSSEAFRLLTLEGLTAFLMGIGWGGLAALKGAEWSIASVVAVSIVCGVAMVWLQGLLLRAVVELQASGNVPITEYLGAQGVVYVTVPGGGKGRGQVTLVVHQRQRQVNAITNGEDLPSKTRVNVVGINNDNTVTVQRAG